MKIISFLVVFFVSTHLAFPYTVILSSGKTIEGTLVGENSLTVQIKDNQGTVLSFKKSMLDLDEMSEANQVRQQEQATEITPALPISKSLVELAEETKRSRTGFTRVYTRVDLNYVPEVSVVGSTGDVAPAVEESPHSPRMPSKEEQYWRKTARSMKKELDSLREKEAAARQSCSRAREELAYRRIELRKAPSVLKPIHEPAECERVEEITGRVQEAEFRLYEFEDRAREAGVPWEWLQ